MADSRNRRGPWARRVFFVGVSCYLLSMFGAGDTWLVVGWGIEMVAGTLYVLGK